RKLASMMEVSRPAITCILDRLVQLGLVARRTDPRDRRSIVLERTRVGREFLRHLISEDQ
ncbi:MAG TPA: MarR family transcriptional regulator, partial [Acetobacteraceae bacterium]|nr:MarR family transcriptional regulator [Acetobacteraceae bacterium]